MPLLFEYHNESWVDDPESLKDYLVTIWKDRYSVMHKELEEDDYVKNKKDYQPFLSFDGNIIRAKNYVGFIQSGDFHLEIYPKVFKSQLVSPLLMLKHLFFWFDYCSKWKFPFAKTNLDSLDDIELPELIIHLMASKMLETVSISPISLYQPVEESLYTPKGKISFSRYLSLGFISGNQHIIDCDHEPFVFDNRLNRVIKYTTRLLLNKTKFVENQHLLQELIFILDEVEDQPCSHYDLETIVLNPLFSEYADVIDICKIVLQQSIYANQQYDLSQWSLLFPMEYIFEDFIAGFLKTHFSADWRVEYQKSNLNLSSMPEAFQMQHDIFLTSKKDRRKKILVDTKYKLRENDSREDKKKGINQADMYQMVSYAFRRGCNEVLLIYPNTEKELKDPDTFIIESGFQEDCKIRVVAAEVPFWSSNDFANLSDNLKDTLQKTLLSYV